MIFSRPCSWTIRGRSTAQKRSHDQLVEHAVIARNSFDLPLPDFNPFSLKAFLLPSSLLNALSYLLTVSTMIDIFVWLLHHLTSFIFKSKRLKQKTDWLGLQCLKNFITFKAQYLIKSQGEQICPQLLYVLLIILQCKQYKAQHLLFCLKLLTLVNLNFA